MKNPGLWAKLQDFRFDATSGGTQFSLKLADEQGWSRDFTARVIEEYRRFIYLSQISDTPVTPRIPVDQAWHMHLN